MKGGIITLFVMLLLMNRVFSQDETAIAGHKFEIKLAVPLQRTFFTDTELKDIDLPKQHRYKPGISVGIKYYAAKHWFAEYELGFSPEGGGFSTQFTNANYLKNSIRFGYSALHLKKVIFSIYTGLDINLLLSAKFKNAQSGEKENVKSYFNNTTFGLPLGIDFKTKIRDGYYVGLGTYVVAGLSVVNKNTLPEEFQYIVPAFKLSISKLIQ